MRFESLPIYAGLATAYTASTIDTLHLIVNTPLETNEYVHARTHTHTRGTKYTFNVIIAQLLVTLLSVIIIKQCHTRTYVFTCYLQVTRKNRMYIGHPEHGSPSLYHRRKANNKLL